MTKQLSLVDRARNGDRDALAELYRGSVPQIQAVGARLFRGPGSKWDIEDFVADVWLLALQYLHTFRGDCQFNTWVVRIAKHRVLAILQQRAQPKNGDAWLVYQGPDVSDEQWEALCFARTYQHHDAVMARLDVTRLLGTLGPAHRQVITLFYLWGFTESEIASRLGLSVPAVRSRLWRAMAQLQKRVEFDANRFEVKISLTMEFEWVMHQYLPEVIAEEFRRAGLPDKFAIEEASATPPQCCECHKARTRLKLRKNPKFHRFRSGNAKR